jgi:tetratricopeptide (TPR) repeat protein
MRAKAALAEALWESGNFYPAMAHSREMLKLNPNDNQGIRHLLANYYLELEMVDDLALLLDDYPGDMRSFFQYTRALLAYRQSSPDADDMRCKLRFLIDTSPACYRSADYRSSLTVDISR